MTFISLTNLESYSGWTSSMGTELARYFVFTLPSWIVFHLQEKQQALPAPPCTGSSTTSASPFVLHNYPHFPLCTDKTVDFNILMANSHSHKFMKILRLYVEWLFSQQAELIFSLFWAPYFWLPKYLLSSFSTAWHLWCVRWCGPDFYWGILELLNISFYVLPDC